MRFISRKLHAVLDYLSVIILIVLPFIMGFEGISKWVAIFVGLMILAMSMLTDYEGGFSKAISMKIHLSADVITGFFLALSPWILNFSNQIYLPHLLMGILAISAGLFTVKKSQYSSADLE